MDGTERKSRGIYERERGHGRRSPPLYNRFSVATICRCRRRKYDQIFAANKAYGEGINIYRTSRILLRRIRSNLRFNSAENEKDRGKEYACYPGKEINARVT